MNNYTLGAHVSIAGGMLNAFERIAAIGGNSFQMFSCSPRDWKNPNISEDVIEQFGILKKDRMIGSIYFHANYLINLAAVNYIAELSVKSLITELSLASKLGVTGSVVHTGSFFERKSVSSLELTKDKYNNLFHNIWEILANTPEDTVLMLENAGSRKIGTYLEEIGYIIDNLHSPRVKVCLDTCHLHATGYDLVTEQGFEKFLGDVDRTIGWERVELIHLNDSKDARGSFRDRHENIGKGNVGIKALINTLHHPKTKNLSFILEVPGLDGKGPDRENMDLVKQLIGERA